MHLFESRVAHRYTIQCAVWVYTDLQGAFSRGTYTGPQQRGPTRARTCVKHYADMQKPPLEMQIFAVSAIKALGARKSRPFLYLPIVEKTRLHLQKCHGESEPKSGFVKSILLTSLQNDSPSEIR